MLVLTWDLPPYSETTSVEPPLECLDALGNRRGNNSVDGAAKISLQCAGCVVPLVVLENPVAVDIEAEMHSVVETPLNFSDKLAIGSADDAVDLSSNRGLPLGNGLRTENSVHLELLK
jgi:hypothetical protein